MVLRHVRRVFPGLVVCGGAAGLGGYVGSAVSMPAAYARVAAALAMALAVGVVDRVGRALGADGRGGPTLRGVLARGADVAWPAALVLWAMPLAWKWRDALGGHLAAATALVATGILAWRVDRESATRIPIVAQPIRRASLGVWEAALLALAIAVALLYLRLGAGAEGNIENDSAYYFGVARHMALTGHFEEPIVWNFLDPPPTLVHPAFDYWGGLTSMVLAPILAVFGASEHTAFIAMAAISGASVIAFWFLVCEAIPIRYAPLQLLGLLTFAFASMGRRYRFDTESLPLYQLLEIVLLIGLATARDRLAIVSAFLLALCRVDGMLLFVVTTILVVTRGRLRAVPRERLRLAWLSAGLFAAYALRNLGSFHTLLPPGVTAAARIDNQRDLYVLHRDPGTAWKMLTRVFDPSYFVTRLEATFHDVFVGRIVPAAGYWFALAALGTALGLRHRARFVTWLPRAGLAALIVIPWLAGPMYHGWRTLNAHLPLIVVALLAGVSALFDGLVAATRRLAGLRRAWALGAAALVFAGAYPIATQIEFSATRHLAVLAPAERELRALDPVLDGAPVAATYPWYVMAQTRSPVVSIPKDGDASIAEVIHRYAVRWIVIVGDAGGLKRVLDPLPADARASIGDVTVERVPVEGSVRLYRVLTR